MRARLAALAVSLAACTTEFDIAQLPSRDAGVLDHPLALDAPDVVDAPPAMDAVDAPIAMDVVDAPIAMDVVDAPPPPDAPDVPIAMDVVDVPPARDVVDVPPARDVVDVPMGCPTGFANCDTTRGCATDLRFNTLHCGECGLSCLRPNAVVACVEGRCALRRCQDGFADCDENPNNGCEVDLSTNLSHCGACGTACPSGTLLDHVRAACVNGTCQKRCLDGWYDCDGNPSECEIAVVGTLCMPCNDSRCANRSLPPGRVRHCCAFLPSMPECCSR